MNNECTDRDLLAMEPVIFSGGGFPAQTLAAGTGGAIAGTMFSCAGASFESAGVKAGMVLCAWTTTPAEGVSCEIVSVDSQTQLTVSMLRADAQSPAVPPRAQSNLAFHVRTFGPQIADVARTLSESLRQISEAGGVRTADFADSSQLRQTVACGALAGIFVARADNARDADANWVKAEHYRKLFVSLRSQLRLSYDADGDGEAESTRSVGNVTLRRV